MLESFFNKVTEPATLIKGDSNTFVFIDKTSPPQGPTLGFWVSLFRYA